MMPSAPCEFHRLTPGLFIWHRYAPQVKADLFSTGLQTAAGLYLIDPIDPPPPEMQGLAVTGVIVTNLNHVRAAPEFSKRLQVPILAAPAAQGEFGALEVLDLTAPGALPEDIAALPLAGAPRGEIALHCEKDGGTLILGDALINMESHGFTFLPPKYCENAKLLRKSVCVLLHYRFTRILFAHGAPITTQAESRLATLLDA